MLITTLVVSFCKDGRGSVNVKLWFLVVYVRCKDLCRSVVLDNVFLLILIVVIHTQGNTMITTHKGSQLLKLIETRYQVQLSDKELHAEHISLRTIILH